MSLRSHAAYKLHITVVGAPLCMCMLVLQLLAAMEAAVDTDTDTDTEAPAANDAACGIAQAGECKALLEGGVPDRLTQAAPVEAPRPSQLHMSRMPQAGSLSVQEDTYSTEAALQPRQMLAVGSAAVAAAPEQASMAATPVLQGVATPTGCECPAGVVHPIHAETVLC